ncbi:hypothetical protein ACJRO7_006800 [Eucalyptus globulus]|uniref:Cytochrome P450 n=1 Tax=Eucalyptus globulus TaxID=34317 RepID=A0ABD3IN33_EUCGL
MTIPLGVFLSLFLVGLICLFLYLYNLFWWKPLWLRKKLRHQGIHGPNEQSIGNSISHDYMSCLFPHIEKWRADYGPVFAFTQGNMVIVCVCDFDVAREFCQCKSAEFGRSAYLRKNRGIVLGYDSLVTSKEKSWALHRKVIAPEFFSDQIKKAGGVASLRIDKDLKSLSAEMISKACFGSNNVIGNEIFTKMLVLQNSLSKQQAIFGLPGGKVRAPPSAHIRTKITRDIWRTDKEVDRSILKLMDDDCLSHNFGRGSSITVDNCKAMIFAGHETTATAWQECVRAEVVQILGHQAPNMDKLQKMKLLNMVIYETLRLYSPGPFVTRETSEEMKFGDFAIPIGVNVWLSSLLLHQDPANWFANGISSACKNPNLFVPFGMGLWTFLSLVLSKFFFSLSLEYKRSVTYKLFFEPEHGVQLKMEKIRNYLSSMNGPLQWKPKHEKL